MSFLRAIYLLFLEKTNQRFVMDLGIFAIQQSDFSAEGKSKVSESEATDSPVVLK